MKKEDLLESLGEAGADYAAETAPESKAAAPRRRLRFLLPAAAALILALVGWLALRGSRTAQPTLPAETDASVISTENAAAPSQPSADPISPTESGEPSPETSEYQVQTDFSSENLLASPTYPTRLLYPTLGREGMQGIPQASYEKWNDSVQAVKTANRLGDDDAVMGFARACMTDLLLQKPGENAVISPLNLYLALGMLSEVTAGNPRAEILSLLGADSLETLRERCGRLWNYHYENDGANTCLLSSSLWLRKGFDYNLDTLSSLSANYYASAFAGEMGSEPYTEELQRWLSQMTGGLLDGQIGGVKMDDETLLMLVTSVLYRAKWQDEFTKARTESGVFHAAAGDAEAFYMKRDLDHGPLYYGDRFMAVELRLADDAVMRFLLPDEGYAPADLLRDEESVRFLTRRGAWTQQSGEMGDWSYYAFPEWEKKSDDLIVHLSLPRFKTTSDLSVNDALQKLGVTELFSQGADLSPLFANTGANQLLQTMTAVGKIEHAATLSVDEEGVTAAAYTVMPVAGAAPPPEKEIDLTFDRPFVYAIISSDYQPLFVGVVNTP